MAIKAAVNRRISELKGYYEVLGNSSSESRVLKENYEKEKMRSDEDFTSQGLVNPREQELDQMKDQYLLAEDKVKSTKENISKIMDSIKKDAEKLANSCRGIEEEKAKIEQMEEKLKKDKENSEKKIASKKRRLELLIGDEKNRLQGEINKDIADNEENFKDLDEEILNKYNDLRNLEDARDSYNAYMIEYNKYALDKLPEIDSEKTSESIEHDEETIPEDIDEEEKAIPEDREKDDEKEVSGGAGENDKPIPGSIEKGQKPYEIKTKDQFDDAYKELKKGILPREKRNILYGLLDDKSKFDELGITTGVIFNKAKYILKAQGKDLKIDINQFIGGSKEFSKEIKFDSSKDIRIDRKDLLSTNDLTKWGQIQDLTSDKTLNIENYIQEIEQAKLSGMELSEEQEKMYNDSMFLKGKLEVYRGRLQNYSEIKTERSWAYEINEKKSLPEASDKEKETTETLETHNLSEELSRDVITPDELSDSVRDVLEARGEGKESTIKEPKEDMEI